MKKILLAFVLFTIATLAFPTVSNATEIKFKVFIGDTCQPQPYHGDYCIYVTVKHNGDIKCTFTICNAHNGAGGYYQLDYTGCSDFAQEYEATYEIDITVCRQNSSGCCDTPIPASTLYPYQLNDNSVSFYPIVH